MLIKKSDLEGLSVDEIRANPKRERRLRVLQIILKSAKRLRPLLKISPWFGAVIDLIIDELSDMINESLEEYRFEKLNFNEGKENL